MSRSIHNTTRIEIYVDGKLWYYESIVDSKLAARFVVLRAVTVRTAGMDPWAIYFVKRSRMQQPDGKALPQAVRRKLARHFVNNKNYIT